MTAPAADPRAARLLGADSRPTLLRGDGPWLWDVAGQRYLDAEALAVPLGHAHPAVIEAMSRQVAILDSAGGRAASVLLDHAEALLARFGGGLDRVLYAGSGAEATDVALRMARATTGRVGVIAVDGAGQAASGLAATLGAGRTPGGGLPPWVRLLPAPGSADWRAESFARNVHEAVVELEEGGFGLSALFLCPVFAHAGLPDLPADFAAAAVAAIRRARGLVIADERQTGFGRLGGALWGHVAAGIAPDIVVLGRGMANGQGCAAVVAAAEVMADFRDAGGWGQRDGGDGTWRDGAAGSPVALAAALALLRVIEDERLEARAASAGGRLLKRLRGLRHPRLGAVRGRGLLLAVEPAGAGGAALQAALKARGVLAGRAGPDGRVVMLAPPLTAGDAALADLGDAVEAALDDLPAPRGA